MCVGLSMPPYNGPVIGETTRRGRQGLGRLKLPVVLYWAALVFFIGCGDAPPGEVPPSAPLSPLFDEVAAASGIDHVTVSGRTGGLFSHEIMGGGCALFDFDNDGDLDAFFVQGRVADPTPEPASVDAPRDRLYRNDLEGGRLHFTDVTEDSGIIGLEHGMGVATGDIDNDGDIDLYVTAFGPNHLWRNNGDGTFTDVTGESGTAEDRWSSAATFADVDRDGWLDLYVVNYLDYGFHNHRPCAHPSSAPEYCGPTSYDSVPDRLFRNRGDGTFEDISVLSQVGLRAAPGLGVVATDSNHDGLPDLYVANDNADNMLWINLGDGRFSEEGVLAGCAVNWSGEREASMGVSAGDYDGDGDEDIFVAHMDGETNTLYLNTGGLFDDRSMASGLGRPSRRHTAYAPAWLDFDNDGLLDLFLANGAMQIFNDWAPPGRQEPLAEPNQLFHNLGGGRFVEISELAGEALLRWEVSRGAAVGDVDNDGDSDVLVTNLDGPVRLFLNRRGSSTPWVGLRLVTVDGARDGLGATVELLREGRPALLRVVRTDGSYCSANEPRLLFGLGDGGGNFVIRVSWPNGLQELFRDLDAGAYTELRQGTGVLQSRPSGLPLTSPPGPS